MAFKIDNVVGRVVGAPIELFINTRFAARFWFFTFILTLAAFVANCYYMPLALKKREHIVILDPSGTYHVAPILGLGEAKTMINHCATLAVLGFLSRGPTVLDNNMLFQQMFSGDAFDYCKKHVEKTASEFKNAQLHQKPEISKITTDQKGESVYVWVDGQLVRTGVVKGSPYVDPKNFTLIMRLIPNPNVSANGRLPLVVWWCKLEVEDYRRAATGKAPEGGPAVIDRAESALVDTGRFNDNKE